jgi:2-phosphoglycerate kinase
MDKDKQKNKAKIIGIYGVNGSGKSTLSHLLGGEMTEFDIISTDHLITLKRKIDTTNPVLRNSSYNQWERFGEPTKENIWKGFTEYRATVTDYLHHILSFAGRDKPGMIIEGLHIEQNPIIERFPMDDIRLIFLNVESRELHRKRLENKYNYQANMSGGRLERYFPIIRELQAMLKEEAESMRIPIVENSGSISEAMEKLREYTK